MAHNAVLGSQQLTEKQIIDRTHPAVVLGKTFRQDGRVLNAGVIVATDANGEMAAYEPGLADAGAWEAEMEPSAGDLVKPTTPNGHYYRCVTGGVADAATEPTWPTATGASVADGTVVWQEAGLLGVDDLAGGGVLTERIDTAAEQVGAVLVHGTAVAANLSVAGAAPAAADLATLEGIGIYPI
ncbi:hypothetical protein [Desulfofustis limnaeus]|uniref:Head decoration protein n=1 Tax=Desulfofustis limnaeus TaxID=2740163 RepID=A0ABM7W4T4_9BACT|nr:hypothetical protein [Desulfofustis limnaeus]BDD85931.1 hypothetical protein DPPLL_02960 [Desulfofustis limnaeus]